MADVYNFSQHPTEITISGDKKLMTRHEIILFKLFETAMKGRITAIKLLLEKFKEAALSREFLLLRYDEYTDAIASDPDSVPDDIKRLVRLIEASADRPRSKIRMTQPPKQK